jgi:hypothetical protein
MHEANCLFAFLDAAAHIKKRKDQLTTKNTQIFAHDLQGALKLTVGFSNIYCKL